MLQARYFKGPKEMNAFLATLDTKDIVSAGIHYMGQEVKTAQLTEKDPKDGNAPLTIEVPINTFEVVYQVRSSDERQAIQKAAKEFNNKK